MGEKKKGKQNEQNKRIHSLKYISTLSKDDASFGAYLRQLEEAMRSRSLHNIALEGQRGSGKSSIIHSYDNDRYGTGGEKLLYISLAEFEGTKPTDKEQLKKRLEYSMLSQILARCTKRDLRGSSLRAIPEVRESRRWVWFKYAYVFSLVLLICALLYDAKFHLECFGTMVEKVWTPNKCHLYACALAAMMTFGLGAYLFSRKPGFFRFGKFNVKTAKMEAEVVPSADIYCLDQYRFDLVHILNQIAPRIGYTVVIEDLELVKDKQYAMDIMNKLRELNLMVNAHRQEQFRARSVGRGWILRILNWLNEQRKGRAKKEEEKKEASSKKKQKKENLPKAKKRPETTWLERHWLKWVRLKEPIRFIYAVDNNWFDADSRIKFFDTIIPVTPALNHMNAEELQKNIFTGTGLDVHNAETADMISKLARAVTDYRMLYDIKTEYLFFQTWRKQNRPDPPGTDDDTIREIEQTLFAIAAYKVLFPHSYHQAFTKGGNGMLRNLKADRIEGEKYGSGELDFVEFLFEKGYLNKESLIFVGYSQEELKQQWTDILINGTCDEMLDLMKRFNSFNRDREPNVDQFEKKVMEMQAAGSLDMQQNANLIRELGGYIYDNAEDALKGFYAWLFHYKLSPEGLINLLLYLTKYTEADLKKAIDSVNKPKDAPHQQSVINKDFKKKLKAILDSPKFQSGIKNDEKLKEKVNYREKKDSLDCAAVIALILGENEQSVRDQYLNVKSKATVS